MLGGRLQKKWKYTAGLLLALSIVYYFSLPKNLFHDPYSTVLEDHEGELLSASIAEDGQWRFPKADSIPNKFAEALITFEDKRFRSHPGFDVHSMGRAIRQNFQSGKIVSGGSTLTMQVVRLSRKGKSRTFIEKFIEIILATRLELRYSKNEILNLYASHAPFGGNVVGLEAACWRYFGRAPDELSWGEAAMLAVLPNSPSLIHLSKNRNQLKQKRDRLLDKLQQQGKLDAFTCSLAKEEPIPGAPQPLPRHARHLLTRLAKDGYRQRKIISTLQYALQVRVEEIIKDHHERLKGNQIFNGAALVLDVKTGSALAYVGNTTVEGGGHFSDDVDVITAARSTGSILKPFLYATMLDDGKILAKTLLPDVPTLINGFAPKNFTHEYDGVVAADKALIRSLNVPAVHLLRQYRYEKFHSLLTDMGMCTLNKPPDHYGLSLILGGAEGSLWDIAGMYASMARTLNHFHEHPGKNRYDRNDFRPATYVLNERKHSESPSLEATSFLSASAIYQTFDALKEVYRPGEETGWRYFNSARRIAWKTGTSFGFRDGWAIGVTPDYVVGVWVGNADGEGRPGLTGTETAAPIMFDIFSLLPGQGWFQPPVQEMVEVVVCTRSGQRISDYCEQSDTVWATKAGLQSAPCSYHKRIHLSPDQRYRVTSECEPIDRMVAVNWFVLPPVQEFYFRPKNVSYKTLPPFRSDCQSLSAIATMDLIYPKSGSRVFVPRELSGSMGSVVFQLAHSRPATIVYWHLDGNYIGYTQKSHHLALNPAKGNHILTLVDASGETLERTFEVISE
ncbi:MAG: penicillin-binding protein 1C [Cyclobacteriaceae bacterium]|nr:penicillin-binding protein 1C [Cyclobacteriaceae bacterium]